ncbi:Protein N-acetyltransferase, RimJ/RimL family [Tindallia magadiensis]|uniref:Protein N-acetyltransferase, RimJ/RimL family n=1 Tax=Tindallia magadiensis TaxID=69895 RepID=A0A1I3C1Y3_9FIRM|nr:GNAT family protein [Tindallia magadiensis]SFH68512.1 Protein N-acetyltransferase, RimJ/RimL family [Tindallia magadiensis]
MTKIVIQNDIIRLRDTTPQDLDQVLRIERNEENRRYVYNWPKARHLESINASEEKHFVVEDQVKGDVVGYIILSSIGSPHNVIEFDRITIDKKGKGYGRQAVRLIKQLCFESYGCHRLWLDVFDDNPKAKALYESEGFVFEGTLRDCKKYEDGYRSMHILSMLSNEYKKE